MEDCLFCDRKFEDYSIRKYDNWDVQVFVDDQYYLGRCVVVLRSRHIVNMVNMNEVEREELFNEVLPDLNTALDSAFSPDLYNYASLGNDCRHLHYHIIPRYKDEREFNGMVFEDEFWNKHYAQDYDRVKLDNSDLRSIMSEISKSF